MITTAKQYVQDQRVLAVPTDHLLVEIVIAIVTATTFLQQRVDHLTTNGIDGKEIAETVRTEEGIEVTGVMIEFVVAAVQGPLILKTDVIETGEENMTVILEELVVIAAILATGIGMVVEVETVVMIEIAIEAAIVATAVMVDDGGDEEVAVTLMTKTMTITEVSVIEVTERVDAVVTVVSAEIAIEAGIATMVVTVEIVIVTEVETTEGTGPEKEIKVVVAKLEVIEAMTRLKAMDQTAMTNGLLLATAIAQCRLAQIGIVVMEKEIEIVTKKMPSRLSIQTDPCNLLIWTLQTWNAS